jgi:hypothetical protein
MSEHIVKLSKHISETWDSLEKAARDKERTAVQNYLDRINHLENLKAQQIALEQSIAVSISGDGSTQVATPVINHQSSNHSFQVEPHDYISRRKRKTVKPREVKLGSFRKPVFFSNEILITVANWLIEQGKALPTIPNFVHPSNSGFSPSAMPRQLVNGSFIEIGDNQEMLLQKARRLLDACGYHTLKLEVAFEDGTSKTC